MKFYIFASCEHEPDYVSANVMKKTDSLWSHVGIIIENDNGHSMINDATAKGVTEHPLEDFLKDHYLIHKIDITQFIISEQYALGWLQCSIGKSYSKKMYVGYLFKFLRKFVRDGNKEVVCSEQAARFINDCTILLCFSDDDLDFLDQKIMIVELIKEISGKR